MKILVLLLALVSTAALAAPVSLNWLNPATYTDNSPLLVTDITQTRIEYGSCVGTAFGVKAGQFIVAGGKTVGVSPDLPPGTYCFQAFTTAQGMESVASLPASKVISHAAPQPPTGLTASVQLTDTKAYTLEKSPEQLVMLPYGTLPAGTQCDLTQSTTVNGVTYNLVNHLLVVPTGSVRTVAAFARCS